MAERPIKISCRGLWKVFGPQPQGFLAASASDGALPKGHIAAVEDVSFDVAEGEILVVMGLSGSGKSTLIRCITRLIEPDAGEVVYDGRNLLKTSARELIELRRHKMGMVFQHFGLLPHRSVLSNVAFPLEVRGMLQEEREARAREMIRLVGLEGRESYFPRELSGGQQQRVGIARSLAVEPDVWFLDEPFSALDPLIRREMQDEFLRLQRMLKKTIVFITHDFEEAVRLADRIGIMKNGRLVQLCTPEEMVTNPADDYVAEFTKNAPRGRIITVRSIMDETSASLNGGGVLENDKVGDVARKVLESERDLPVTDEHGRPVGRLSREAVIRALFEERRQ